MDSVKYFVDNVKIFVDSMKFFVDSVKKNCGVKSFFLCISNKYKVLGEYAN